MTMSPIIIVNNSIHALAISTLINGNLLLNYIIQLFKSITLQFVGTKPLISYSNVYVLTRVIVFFFFTDVGILTDDTLLTADVNH